VDKVLLGQVFVRVLRFSPVIVIPPMLHNHLRLHVALTRETNGSKRGDLLKNNVLSEIEECWKEG
jgi:hypothetical protein